MVTSEKQENGEHRLVVSYYCTRDSEDGVLAEKCDLWAIKPLRSRQGGRVCWLPRAVVDHGHLGQHSTAMIMKWYGVYPETDLELISVEQWWVDPVKKEPPAEEKKPVRRRKKAK